jgi:hypothetical protein
MHDHQPADRRAFLKSASAAGLLGLAALPESEPARAGSPPPPRRPEDLTADHFSDLVGSRFGVETEPGRFMAVELIEVNRLTDHGKPGFRRPFSLVFRVPGGTRLGQDVYRIRHRRVGTMAALLVPVDLPARYNHLETVIS